MKNKRRKLTGVYWLIAVMLVSICPTARAEDATRQEEEETRMVGLLGKDRMTVGDAAGTYTVSFETMPTATWRISSDSSWLTVNTPTITGNSTISFSVTSNPAATTRVAVITVTHTAAKGSRNIIVMQGKLVYPVAGYNSAEEIHNVTDNSKGEVVNGIGSITSFYGYRTTAGASGRHWAIDIDIPKAEEGKNIPAFAALNGRVVTVGFGHEVNGNYVVLEHTVIGSGGNTITLRTKYLHLKSISVTRGTTVRAGATVGIVGDTGSAKGDVHLHFSVLKQVGIREDGKDRKKFFYLNPVAYYHGCDDRGFRYKNGMTAASMTPKNNNPMFVIQGEAWVVNPEWDPTYALFTNNLCDFYNNYMNAIRNGVVISAKE